jgi:hypothetical protein
LSVTPCVGYRPQFIFGLGSLPNSAKAKMKLFSVQGRNITSLS